jgi:putative membrane protein
MMRTGSSLLAIAVALVIVGGCSKGDHAKRSSKEPAQRPVAVGTGGAAGDVKSDSEFVHEIALMNLAEIELSRMALQKSASGDVKSFAQQVINDHDAAGNQLKAIASGHQIEWPAQLDDKDKGSAADLAKEQDGDFDRDYAKEMVEGHQNLAALLESRLDVQSLTEWKTAAAARTDSKALPDPKAEMADVKVRPNKGGDEFTTKINQWAADIYPVVQKHLDSARTLKKETKKRSTAP